MVEHGNELKRLLKENKLVLGTKVTLKKMRDGEASLSSVYLARNCPQDVKDEIHHYAALADIPVEGTDLTNEDIGVLCKKSYLVSVVGILK